MKSVFFSGKKSMEMNFFFFVSEKGQVCQNGTVKLQTKSKYQITNNK